MACKIFFSLQTMLFQAVEARQISLHLSRRPQVTWQSCLMINRFFELKKTPTYMIIVKEISVSDETRNSVPSVHRLLSEKIYVKSCWSSWTSWWSSEWCCIRGEAEVKQHCESRVAPGNMCFRPCFSHHFVTANNYKTSLRFPLQHHWYEGSLLIQCVCRFISSTFLFLKTAKIKILEIFAENL